MTACYNPRMGKRPKKTRKDVVQNALAAIEKATGEKLSKIEEPPPEPDTRDPAAVALGRKGGLKGGKARAAKLSAQQRSAIAKKAAQKRWGRQR